MEDMVTFHGPRFEGEAEALEVVELLGKLASLVPTYATWSALGRDGCECTDNSVYWVGLWPTPSEWAVGFGEDEYAAEDCWRHKTLLGALRLVFSQVPEWEKDIARWREEIEDES